MMREANFAFVNAYEIGLQVSELRVQGAFKIAARTAAIGMA